jgi:hypothetical protein
MSSRFFYHSLQILIWNHQLNFLPNLSSKGLLEPHWKELCNKLKHELRDML